MSNIYKSVDEDRLLSIDEAAELLGVSRYFIWEHLHKKSPLLPHVKISRRCTRFRRSDLRAFAESLAVKG